jgi:hypothetical protein
MVQDIIPMECQSLDHPVDRHDPLQQTEAASFEQYDRFLRRL